MRSRSAALLLPRYIRPVNLEVGDRIRVTYPAYNGIVRTMEGVIGTREYHGRLRTLSTREGAVLVAYVPGESADYTVTLLERRAIPQTPLEGVEW